MATSSFLPARRHLAFVIGLGLAVATAMLLDRNVVRTSPLRELKPDTQPALAPSRALSAEDRQLAAAAWSYFPANTRPSGLVDSVAQYPASTMWDTGSSLLGMVSAHRLGLIATGELASRAGKLLDALAAMPLYDGRVPNKSYNTLSAQMVNYNNEPSAKGIGWSALDLARLAVALEAVARAHPPLAPRVEAVVNRIDWRAMVTDGVLMGTEQGESEAKLVQEGRVGYEQYGARAFQLFGLDPYEAGRVESHLQLVGVENVRVPADDRTAEKFGARVFVLSEPYMLMGLEFGLEGPALTLAQRVYQAQANRFRASGKPTAVTEDHLDRDPRFVYNTVWGDGQAWACLTDLGEFRPQDRTLSTKAAMSWSVLFGGDYGDRLRQEAAQLVKPGAGFMAGRYEEGGQPNTVLTANTNGIVLEALAYQVGGPLLRGARP